jgi:two-component system phosphate regulon sensor histidine kinase PhoR
MKALFNSRLVAFFISLLIATTTAAFLSLLESSTQESIITAFLLAFTSGFLLTYITFEYLIFREINRLYATLDKLRKKDPKPQKQALIKNKLEASMNPISQLKAELSSFATGKQQEIEELKKLEAYRREFIADVSHELKTPIFAAQGFIHTLIDGAAEDEAVRTKFLKKAAKSLDGLNILVQDLLILSQMETGTIRMHKETFDVRILVQEVFEQLEKLASKRSMKLRFDQRYDKPLLVVADRNRMRQVFGNLIENSAKYGLEEGKITVGFETVKDGLIAHVKDDGPGIDEVHLNRIFDRFYRIDKSRNKDTGGTGLGLAIVKQILQAHQSKIAVKSKTGKETVFTFRLQRAEV